MSRQAHRALQFLLRIELNEQRPQNGNEEEYQHDPEKYGEGDGRRLNLRFSFCFWWRRRSSPWWCGCRKDERKQQDEEQGAEPCKAVINRAERCNPQLGHEACKDQD